MKILLDECVTKKLKPLLPGFDVFTVSDMGWNGLKNGRLLSRAEENGFDILLTIDKNIDSQQNIARYRIALVILDVEKSNLKFFEPIIPLFISGIQDFRKGNSYLIPPL